LAFAVRNGPSHGLLDFSEVDTIAVSMTLKQRRGLRPPARHGLQRTFVVPQSPAFDFRRTFADQQAALGMGHVRIVATLAEAHELLGFGPRPRFEPVD
jgi:hypothetical protein